MPWQATSGDRQSEMACFTAATSAGDMVPVVSTCPQVIFHGRNGPVMSPCWSKTTGPTTPS